MKLFDRILMARAINKIPLFTGTPVSLNEEAEDLRDARTAGETSETTMNEEYNAQTTTTNADVAENDKDSQPTEAETVETKVADTENSEIVNQEAAMENPNLKVKSDDSKIDFSMFGVKMDLKESTEDAGVIVDFMPPPITEDSYMPYAQVQQMLRPAYIGRGYQPGSIPAPQFEQMPPDAAPSMQQSQPVQQPVPQPVQQAALQQPVSQNTNQVNHVVGKGRHKIDYPADKPKPQKAEEAKVDVDLNLINIPKKDPVVKEVPEIIENKIPAGEPIQPPPPKFDNSELIKVYKYLEGIEKIACECEAQVKFDMLMGSNGKASGLIMCTTYTNDHTKPNPYKCFVIDTGKIIDRRAKVLIGNPMTTPFEDMPVYLVLVSRKDGEERSKNKNNVLNEKLFRDIFIGGYQNLEPSRMYTRDFIDLNKCVALITMPTNVMNSDTRKETQARLMKAMKAGVFAQAFEIDPGVRFRFDPGSYNKTTGAFTLTSAGTPKRFCGPCISTKVINIHFDENGKTTLKVAT